MAEITRKELVLIIAAADRRVRLAGVDLSGLDLRGLHLAHADLAGADLRGCDLSDANLFQADLTCADLTDAMLRGVFADEACFIDAKLERVDFRRSERDLFHGTHLAGANFEGADLTDAWLTGAHLWGASFRRAVLLGTDFTAARMNEYTLITDAPMEPEVLDSIAWAEPPTRAAA